MLGVRRDRRRAVGVEADLGELPVALVHAEAEDVLRVVVVEEPVLQPGAPAGGDDPPVDAVRVAGRSHPLRVLLVVRVGGVQVVAVGRRAAVGVDRVAEEPEREVRQRVGGVRGGDPRPARIDEVVLPRAATKLSVISAAESAK